MRLTPPFSKHLEQSAKYFRELNVLGDNLWRNTWHAFDVQYYFCACLNGLETINFLKPTGHVMHQQFNIQQLYALPTLYLCVLYLSENKQRLVPLTA